MKKKAEQQTQEVGVLATVLTSNKEQIISLAQKTVLDIQERGEQDALKQCIMAKRATEYFDQVAAGLKESALTEASKYGEKTFELIGATVQLKAVSTRWDYSKCGDPLLKELDRKFKAAKKALEDRQKFLQTLSEKIVTVDEESGDVNTIYPAVKIQAEGVSITL